ncbi:MAG: HDOD domain-containing protein [Nitrospirota bacterium]|nr:HDOD domain-containing protein [Nitrospirota bacterium]
MSSLTTTAPPDPAAIKRHIEKMGELPTLPHVVQKIVLMSNRPDTSAEDLGKIIEKDQVLAAKVLKLANSPFYGFPARIASVSHAVVVLGLNVVKGLTLGATAFDMMKAAGMEQLWRHSLGVAMMAHILAARVGVKNPDELFAAGLLHDLGKVVLQAKLSDLGAQIERVLKQSDGSRTQAEQEVLGLTHADMAGWLGDMWHLPSTLKDPMMFHHHPMLARDAETQTAIVHVADVLVKAMGCGDSGDDLVPPLNQKAWTLMKLDEAGLDECMRKAAHEFETIDDYL